jgi:hypothetical protein
MNARHSAVVIFACLLLPTACATVALAPGAEKVRLTSNAQDVAACTAVGNVREPVDARSPPPSADVLNELRNQAIGLGGNTVFVTEFGEGVAYRCP